MADQIATKILFKDLFSIFWNLCILLGFLGLYIALWKSFFFISKYLKDKSDKNENNINQKERKRDQEKKETR